MLIIMMVLLEMEVIVEVMSVFLIIPLQELVLGLKLGEILTEKQQLTEAECRFLCRLTDQG